MWWRDEEHKVKICAETFVLPHSIKVLVCPKYFNPIQCAAKRKTGDEITSDRPIKTSCPSGIRSGAQNNNAWFQLATQSIVPEVADRMRTVAKCPQLNGCADDGDSIAETQMEFEMKKFKVGDKVTWPHAHTKALRARVGKIAMIFREGQLNEDAHVRWSDGTSDYIWTSKLLKVR